MRRLPSNPPFLRGRAASTPGGLHRRATRLSRTYPLSVGRNYAACYVVTPTTWSSSGALHASDDVDTTLLERELLSTEAGP